MLNSRKGIEVTVSTANRLKEMAQKMRLDAIEMALASGSNGSHLGGGLSCIEILATLYGEVMNIDPADGENVNRDRFLASKNHCVLAHIPALVETGFVLREEMTAFQMDGGRLTGYPYEPKLGFEYPGGSLGMAVSVGVGMAISAREHKRDSKIYVLLGDGELDEGSVWEAFMSAAHFRLDNYIAIIDRNHLSYDGNTEEIMGLDSLEAKLKAFNFHTTRCNGHDTYELLKAFADTIEGKPHAIIAETVKGKGISFIENRPEWHHHTLNQEQYEMAKKELMGAI